MRIASRGSENFMHDLFFEIIIKMGIKLANR